MSNVLDLARPEIRALQAYRAAGHEDGMVRLNANETPWPAPGDNDSLNRYPNERPLALTRRLAVHYGLDPGQVLVTRGSTDAIDLLVRGFCRAGRDEIVICPPTFTMYPVYAHIQGAAVREVPLLRERGFALDHKAIIESWTPQTKLLFVCSPNNPTGHRVPDAELDELCAALAGRGLVVVDGAYCEFADSDPTKSLLQRHDNVVVLRTLSKAYGLAGIRCGALLAQAEIVSLLGPVLPPYAFPTPSLQTALHCLDQLDEDEQEKRIAKLTAERARLATELAELRSVTRVWPSQANFLLVEFEEPRRAAEAARRGGVLLRDFSDEPELAGCLRITVGDANQNDQLLASLRDDE
jgi:histidinol-phosphate aminotransferase